MELGIEEHDARLIMVFDGRWKLVYCEGYRPMLFDLETDPDELIDLGESPYHSAEIERLREAMFEWSRRHHSRITRSPEQIKAMTRDKEPTGILIGYWDEGELERDGLPKPLRRE